MGYSLTGWRNLRDPLRQVTYFPLLNNPNKWFYTTRRSPILGICFHIAVALPDFVGEDTSAAAVNNYGRITTRPASWTACSDTDSIDPALPHTYTAFAQGVSGYNFNAPLLSLEMGIYYSDWRKLPDDKVDMYVRMNAAWAAPYVMAYRIPLRLINDRNEIQRLINAGKPVGFCSHGKLAPDRTDPGIVPNGSSFPWNSPGFDTYPWTTFFRYLREEIDARIRIHGDVYGYLSGDYVEEDINAGFPDEHIEWVQESLRFAGLYFGEIDKLKGPDTTKGILAIQKKYGLKEDGLPGPKTSKAIDMELNEIISKIIAGVWAKRIPLSEGYRRVLGVKAEDAPAEGLLKLAAHRAARALNMSMQANAEIEGLKAVVEKISEVSGMDRAEVEKIASEATEASLSNLRIVNEKENAE